MRRRRGTAWLAFGLALLLGAAGLTGYNVTQNWLAGREADGILQELDALRPGLQEALDRQTEQLLIGSGTGNVPDYLLDPDREMPVKQIDGVDYVGNLTVPSLGLDLPVCATWNYRLLRKAPCLYTGTAYKPGMVICAHNYNAHFGRLKTLAIGDEVRFTDMDGNVFLYAVASVEILPPTAVEEMVDSGYDLSLFTCTIGGRTRVTVRCNRI